jgi:uncharacterized protein YutE (UPF0331/DUF86 family)
LKSFQKHSLGEFKNNPAIYGAVERFLQIVIEDCISIGNHIISRLNLRKPEGHREIFTILGENNIMSQDMVPSNARDCQIQKYIGSSLLGNRIG